eukprot:jgi/Chrzof1/10018/Cz04g24090.t1
MQTAKLSRGRCCIAFTRHSSTVRHVIPSLTSSSSTTRCVQVFAKGKRSFRRTTSPQQMTPQQMPQQGAPDIDPENEEFVIFMRATSGPQQIWFPVTIVKGGSPANILVKTCQSEWGRKLFQGTLVRNIGESINKERETIIKTQRKQMIAQGLGWMKDVPAKDFEFGFKIRDKRDAADAAKPLNLTVIPPPEELVDQPLDRVKKFFSNAFSQ